MSASLVFYLFITLIISALCALIGINYERGCVINKRILIIQILSIIKFLNVKTYKFLLSLFVLFVVIFLMYSNLR